MTKTPGSPALAISSDGATLVTSMLRDSFCDWTSQWNPREDPRRYLEYAPQCEQVRFAATMVQEAAKGFKRVTPGRRKPAALSQTQHVGIRCHC